ncbi:MAG: aldolase/citrate lyase family protein [Clostridiales bacterium]|nr:aldolase/citrate lyase family protein [Clostridiales bacterium]
MVKSNAVQDIIKKEGRPAIGSIVMLQSPLGAEEMGKAGFDFVAVDLQHSEINSANLMQIFQALDLNNVIKLVRTGLYNEVQLAEALDFGADGIIVPLVSTPAVAAAAATLFPPDGNRSFGMLRNFTPPGEANKKVMFFPMIETREGLDNIEEIVKVEGVSGVMIGACDLSLSMGYSVTSPHDPEVYLALKKIIEACHSAGKIAGCFCPSREEAQNYLRLGADAILNGADITFVSKGAATEIASVKQFVMDMKAGKFDDMALIPKEAGKAYEPLGQE